MIRITDRLTFDDDRDVAERFVRAAGPHGQNPDRDASAVELRVDLLAASLPDDVKARLRAIAGRVVTKGGVLVVVSRGFRTQAKNREAARARLVTMLRRAARARRARVESAPAPVAVEERLREKHRHSAVKRSRALGDDERIDEGP